MTARDAAGGEPKSAHQKESKRFLFLVGTVLKKREGSWDGRCHFEPWSDDKDGTLAGTLSKVPHRTSGGTLGTADLLENRVSSLEPSGPETETLSLCR
ncbi:hypothetical protein AVEN_430-1 [Araneus ventricosus]|uniref:Uncharacterized protein n=1 Tax=Araneus ventricosus TaxID=182803 RepID=A0A4Y2TF23_ARAVE|nr:hypothetical protein AVEN_430-1 [Araneus ventricosus]